MGRKPELKNLDHFFDKEREFSLTDAQYEKAVGIPLPKDKHYLINQSALAKKCAERGFAIEVIEKKVIIRKR